MTQAKVRIYEISKALDISNKEVMDLLKDKYGVSAKSHSSSIEQDVADKVIAEYNGGGAKKPAAKKAAKKETAKDTKKEAKPAAKKPAKKDDSEKDEPADDPSTVMGNFDASRVRVIRKKDKKKEEEPVAKADESEKEEPKKELPPELKQLQVPKVGTVINPPPETKKKKEVLKPEPLPGLKKVSSAEDNKPAAKKTDKVIDRKSLEKDLDEAKKKYKSPDKKPIASREFGKGRKKDISAYDGGVPFQLTSGPKKKSGARKTKRQLQEERMEEMRRQEEELLEAETAPKVTSITEPLTVQELAEKLRMKDTELIRHLFMQGKMVTVNQTIDVEAAQLIAIDLEFDLEDDSKDAAQPGEQYSVDMDDSEKKLDEKKFKNLEKRAPVVSIMGHVDHGKTSLLDAIRETRHNIVDTEAGGITQSIGAYTVEKNDQKIVFLDTPGHEAFTSMRMRGAQATDIAILVVAADDGVMPQTIEAINHAKAAKIPIIVAVNKIDKENADPDKVLGQLTEYGLTPESWGGETLTCSVSAIQKTGLEDILDNILLVSELLDLKADATVEATGIIVEAQLDKQLGPVATILIQNGTIKVGDNILIGSVGGRIRALISDNGQRIQEAGPATPAEILGLNAVPNAGDAFEVIHNDKEFKSKLSQSQQDEREKRLAANKKSRTTGFATGLTEGDREELFFNVVVKADTQGSLEAVIDQLTQLSTNEIKVQILHSGAGNITEADMMLASTGNAVMLGFNTTLVPGTDSVVDQLGITVKQYDVIYHLVEEVEKMMVGQLSPDTEEVETGSAEVRQIFTIGKNTIAGCMVTNGKVVRNAKAVVVREGETIHEGKISNLKRFKENAKEVASGYECGISFDDFNAFEEGDIITSFVVKELERTSL